MEPVKREISAITKRHGEREAKLETILVSPESPGCVVTGKGSQPLEVFAFGFSYMPGPNCVVSPARGIETMQSATLSVVFAITFHNTHPISLHIRCKFSILSLFDEDSALALQVEHETSVIGAKSIVACVVIMAGLVYFAFRHWLARSRVA